MNLFGKNNKGKNFSNNTRGLSDHHLHPPHYSTPQDSVSTPASAPTSPQISVSTPASAPASPPPLAASSIPPIAVPYEAPQHARVKMLEIGGNTNKAGTHKVGNVKVGKIGAKACQQNEARIGFNNNEGKNQTIGDVTID